MNLEKKKYIYYGTPLLLAIFMFSSNFLTTDIFKFGELNFAVWFVLSLFCFACGWLINITLGWKFGGKIVFAVTTAISIISVLLMSVFKDYFGSSELLAENLILYSLRNVTLGCMGFFGMALAELIEQQKAMFAKNVKLNEYAQADADARREAQLELKEARVKAEKIVNDAQLQARLLIDRRDQIKREINKIIETEKEIIKKFEYEKNAD
jgi:hypothetical protein